MSCRVCNEKPPPPGTPARGAPAAWERGGGEGHRDDFVRLAVVGNSADYCWPCGACRQMLYEFAPDLTVLVGRSDRDFVRLPLHELLPHGFGPKSLA